MTRIVIVLYVRLSIFLTCIANTALECIEYMKSKVNTGTRVGLNWQWPTRFDFTVLRYGRSRPRVTVPGAHYLYCDVILVSVLPSPNSSIFSRVSPFFTRILYGCVVS